MENIILKILRQNDIGEPPWDYYFLLNLDEKEYPRYLAKLFKLNTGENLPLKYDFKNNAWIIDKKRCKTFNQKIQWIKLNFRRVVSPDSISGVRTRSNKKSTGTHKCVNDIMDNLWKWSKDFNEKNSGYGVTDLMRMCTDKVAVREYVKEKIGEEYLKPVLQIIPENCRSALPSRQKIDDVSNYFDQIQWDNLPNVFVIKCNHGSKWQYIIKNKEEFLNTPQLFETVKRNMTGWLEQEFFPWNGFEMQYKGITPKLLIEPFFENEDYSPLREIEVYCFNGKPKIFVNVRYGNQREITYYDEKFNQIDLILHPDGNNLIVNIKADDYINQTIDLSVKLCTSATRLAKDEMTTGDSRRNDSLERKQFQGIQITKNFNFVRIDWIVFKNKLYFNEMTFTPYSGLIEFDKKWNKKLGSYIQL